MYPRTVKVRSSSGTVNEYVRVVEAYREDGKVKQRVVADLGRKDLLVEILPKLRRLLAGDADVESAIRPTPSSAMPRTGGRSSSSAPCSTNWASGRSSTNTSGEPKASPSPTAPSCSSPTGSSPRPVSMGSPAGSRPTSSATARADASSPTGTSAGGSASIPASSMPGTAPSTSSIAAKDRDRSGAVPPPPRPLQPQARPGPLRHHQYLFRGRRPARLRPARLQPRRQAAERPGDRRRGDGRRLADRPSCLGGQPRRPFHGSRSHQRLAQAVRVRPAGLRRRPGHGHR